ncbi:MAG: hypothetical protein R3281_07085 [Balneolaceae bacterium]|nr:hypothetical protein [Balneolaceae bacterium]
MLHNLLRFKASCLTLSVIMIVTAGCENRLLDDARKYPVPVPAMVQADTTDIPASTLKAYRRDAEILAAKHRERQNSKRVTLPEELIDLFFHGMLHLYRSDTPHASRVTRYYKIHNRDHFKTTELIVKYEGGRPWATGWTRGNRFTGNEDIDQLIREFDLYLESHHTRRFSDNQHVLLNAGKPLHLEALANLFSDIDGILYAQPNALDGTSTEIKAWVEPDHVRYEFRLGIGDCTAGCALTHFWVYDVYANGDVVFVEKGGSSL